MGKLHLSIKHNNITSHTKMPSRSLMVSRIIFTVTAAAIIFSNDFSSVARAFTLAPPPSAAKPVIINKKNSKRKNIQVNQHANYVDPFTIQQTSAQSFKATRSRPVAFRRRRIGRSARRLGRRTCVVAYAHTKIDAIDTQHTTV